MFRSLPLYIVFFITIAFTCCSPTWCCAAEASSCRNRSAVSPTQRSRLDLPQVGAVRRRYHGGRLDGRAAAVAEIFMHPTAVLGLSDAGAHITQFSEAGHPCRRDLGSCQASAGTGHGEAPISPLETRLQSAAIRPVTARPSDGDRPEPKDDDGENDDGETAEDRVPIGADQHLRAARTSARGRGCRATPPPPARA